MASCESRRGLLAGDLKNPSRPCYILAHTCSTLSASRTGRIEFAQAKFLCTSGETGPFPLGVKSLAPSLIQTRNGHHLAAKGARVAVPGIDGLSKFRNKSASCCRVQIHIGGSPCPSVFPAQDRASCLRPYSLKVARRGRAHQRCRHACRPENSAILI